MVRRLTVQFTFSALLLLCASCKFLPEMESDDSARQGLAAKEQEPPGLEKQTPIVESVAPPQGPASGGTVITIRGKKFHDSTVTVGGAACDAIAVRSATEITCTTPPRNSGPAEVLVTNSGGRSGSLIDGFTFLAVVPPVSPTPSPTPTVFDPSPYFPVTDLPTQINSAPPVNPLGDDGYGPDGFAFPGIEANVASLQIDGSGKALIAGATSDGNPLDAVLARFNEDGTPDASFGLNGLVKVSIGTSWDGLPRATFKSTALQSDGKIVAGGWTYLPTVGNPSHWSYVFLVARFLSNGVLDSSFAGTGYVVTPLQNGDARIWKMLVQPDGKILAVGSSGWEAPGNHYGTDAALVRYLPDGSLDTGFGDRGIVLARLALSGGNHNEARAAQVTANGDILVASVVFNSGYHWGLARYHSDGTPDLTFGQGGRVEMKPLGGESSLISMKLQGDGKIVITGSSMNVSGGNPSLLVGRFLINGGWDPSFATAGLAVVGLSEQSVFGIDESIAADGRIFVAGFVWKAATSPSDPPLRSLAILGFQPNGALDSDFGPAGIRMETMTGISPVGIGIQRNGQIIVAGKTDSLFLYRSRDLTSP
jgi:uncharacterized delta-60 repeat protein